MRPVAGGPWRHYDSCAEHTGLTVPPGMSEDDVAASDAVARLEAAAETIAKQGD